MKVIILDIPKGIRRLNPDDSYPIVLENVFNGEYVLDWHIKTINDRKAEYFYIGGYHIEKIISKYHEFKFYYHKGDMEKLKIIYDILNSEKDDYLIIQSNILFKSKYIKEILSDTGNNNIGIYKSCVYDEFLKLKTNNNKYYNGIVKFQSNQIDNVLNSIKTLLIKNSKATFSEWIGFLFKERSDMFNYIEVNDDNDLVNLKDKIKLSRFMLGTKAKTLETLKKLVKKSIILDQITFTVEQWNYDKEFVYNKIKDEYINKSIVVRSSSLNEDCWVQSNAGKFNSYLNIDVRDKDKVMNSINNVIKSYGQTYEEDQILIQEFISNSTMSGVLFTRSLEDSSPYYIINYDDESGKTDTVTGGKAKNIKSKFILRNNMSILDKIIKNIIDAAREIESLVGHDGLDIEFILDKNNIYIVQVRPIVTYKEEMILTDDDVFKEIKILSKYVDNILGNKAYIQGNTTILGNMPDWNPAELIGSAPRPLAISLYQKLITNGIWSLARAEIGYKNIGYEPLVISLSGRPYVDVRKSLNSFLPNNLSDKLSNKIINYQINKLKSNPSLHDKIEFKIAKTAMDFNFQKYQQELLENSFTINEIDEFKGELIKITNNILDNVDKSIEIQNMRLNNLSTKRNDLIENSNFECEEIPFLINTLINDCIMYGILPFSILARYAFISMSFLKTLKEKNIFNQTEYDRILLSIPTVASDFARDNNLLNYNKINKEDFLNKYGHLRPNTYDITSPNYIDGYNIFFGNKKNLKNKNKNKNKNNQWIDIIFEEKKELINNELIKNNITHDYSELRDFIKNTIPGREFIKFEFTKNINLVLELISRFGKSLNMTRDELSYISIDKIISLSIESPSYSLEKELKRQYEYNKKKYMLSQSIKLPSLISSVYDITEFSILKSIPNYITNKTANGKVVELNSMNVNSKNIENKIVLIENADPGFDWIFSHKIKGLITKYGGVASHMSIRCAEFGIPASIGAGEILYNNIKSSDIVELNCETQQITVIR